ncbi:ATP-binding protein [Bacillus sp. DTU_2020_1000418_1_SI_GHA_SEK_038]|uniref:two-component system histidine kinase PnpS n=1 Tax=Bacillus sp. DTU_2020_1000418_1_SI_GHA_SEK_038 TaxID=3077585 RepID=UPI0028E24ED3|nr:ATP-binding protein [Bacillus sp. DTU_2020_1000418_1_SI_GHA_SEK_038]WNS74558.1 ATP-binding protein [Bacillus sp. DTU_2020_1000418_1_SI_GHA_SEK_038]
MAKFRSRLLFGLITLIFAVLIGIDLLLGQLFKSYYLNAFDERLNKESVLLSTFIEDEGGIQSINKEEINKYSRMLDARVTVVDVSGNIIHDSGPIMDLSARQHQSIINEMIAYRDMNHYLVEDAGVYDLHYYWYPVTLSGKKEGFIFLSTHMTEINDAYKQIWKLLTIILSISFIFILLLGSRMTARYTKPIEAATKTAIELAKGNYRARTYEDHDNETGMLSASINVLARNLQEMRKTQEMQQDRLSVLIENMGSGLILIDSKGFISMLNRTYKEIFNVNPIEHMNKLYYEVIEYGEIVSLIEEIFMTEEKVKQQIIIPLKSGRRHFEVYGVPIIGTNDVWKGVLLVFHDITDIKKLEQVRRDFVANVSHELKTPITSIKGFSETLLDGAMEDRQSLEAFLKIILQESDRLQTLIHDLLDLSKIEQQNFILSTQRYNIADTLEGVIAILEQKAAEREISLTMDKENDPILIDGDADRLKQIFLNLINNAITYTPNGGSVSISLRESEAKVFIKVRDTGIGISKEEIPRIFERFYRVDKARSRNSGGTGLGLAIVKHLVEAHKGSISVESKIGEGTTFFIELNKKLPTG